MAIGRILGNKYCKIAYDLGSNTMVSLMQMIRVSLCIGQRQWRCSGSKGPYQLYCETAIDRTEAEAGSNANSQQQQQQQEHQKPKMPFLLVFPTQSLVCSNTAHHYSSSFFGAVTTIVSTWVQ